MILLVIITIIFLFYYNKYYKETGPSPLLIFFISFFLLSLFSLECLFGEIEFFVSDEVNYINIAYGKLPSGPNRFLWHLINYLILNHDVSFNGVALKLINIPIAAIFLISLWRIFRNKKIYLIPVILPYFAYIATKNLRDIPILLFTALVILLFYHRKPIYMILSFISLAMLFLLRPFAAVTLLIILLLQICFLTVRPLTRLAISKRYARKLLILAFILLMISPFVVPVIRNSIVIHYNWFNYTTFDQKGYEMRIEKRVGSDLRYASGNRIRDFFVASVRYAVAPIPTSIFGRLMKGGTELWGMVDDLIRLLNQIGYYFLLGYLIINARFILTAFRQMSAMGKAMILYLLTSWPIYSFYYYGTSHQRLKIPFQLAIFLIAVSVSAHKKKIRTNLIKNGTI